MKTAKDYYNEGVKLWKSGQFKEALAAFDRAIGLDENFAVPWNGKGYALYYLGRYEEALAAFDRAIRLDENLAHPWNGKGIALYYLGRYEEALAAFDRAIRLDENLAHPWNGKGSALRSLGRYEEALAAYDRAIGLDENDAALWHGKGNALYSLGRYEEALAAYDRAIGLDENDAALWHGKGNALYSLGRYEEALAAYDRAIGLDENLANPWHGKGNALSDLGRYEEALAAYDRAIGLDENLALPWYGKGSALHSLGRYEEALAAFERAIDLNENDALPWNGKGSALSDLGRYEEALAAFDRAIGLDENSALPWNGKGNALNSLGRYEEALAAFDRAIGLDENFAAPWHGKGNALSSLGRYEEALAAYDEAIGLDENLAAPWYGKAKLYDDLDDARLAHPCLTRTYRLSDEPTFFKFSFSLIGKYFSPLFIHRISREHPRLMTALGWLQTAGGPLRQCLPLLQFIRFIRKYPGFPNEIERLKFLGLIRYYLGDPLEAEELFNKVDDEDESDLMGQYYLIASMNASEENTEGALQFAVDHAGGLLTAESEPDAAQWYYAGHIFRIKGNYGAASTAFERAFKADEDFLSALYMRMFCQHRLNRREERNRLVKQILGKENLLIKENRRGFLGRIMPESVDLNSSGWHMPFVKYARWAEISEALNLLYDLLQNHEDKCGSLPPEISFVNDMEGCGVPDALQVWMQNEKFRAELENRKAEISKYELKELRTELKMVFPFFPLSPEKIAETDTELVIAKMIEDEGEKITGKTEAFHKLLTYCHFTDCLSAREFTFLSYFTIYKDQQHKKSGIKGYAAKFLEEISKTSFAAIVAVPVFGVSGLLTASVGFIGVYSSFSVFYEFLKTAFKGDFKDHLTYPQFKTNFLEFIQKHPGETPETFRDE
ncbi:hypothetical protein DENIS_3008 [Desulfonema ishimotonii]|uniref:Tetratricopeptide repeat protein n=1 Tax=Desulfonema ishimotonii TaxID=45657 RepID=A0A401FYK8_9BACT|nr:tetratricopeptide repeat protein [Desulfonema ishimotonii]GBC62045.1 hypothetical protein DENIS_3008 [Desulfonema ishimotonii]